MKTWEDLAACAGMDTELFFPRTEGAKGSERVNKARETCRRCPVRRDCLDYAIETDRWGIWGGMDTAERKKYAQDHDLI
jgi:WhiB family redox-sensing transcriptional regulator